MARHNYYEYDSKFKVLAMEVCSKANYLGIRARILKYSLRNSVYIQLGDTDNPYYRVRLSDHEGSLVQRYTLREDKKNSERIVHSEGEKFIYPMNSMKSFYMRLAKDILIIKEKTKCRQ